MLGVKETAIHDSQKFDLARNLVDIYAGYADYPRLEQLIELNRIIKKRFYGWSRRSESF
ncbi:hypothetical protein ACU82A_15230 [Bacillus cereus]